MLIFDEKQYAEDILKGNRYKTIKNQGRERCSLARYLNSLGYDEESSIKIFQKIPMYGGEYLTKSEKGIIFKKIIKKAVEYPLISGIEVDIYKQELDIITQLEDKYEQMFLFICLVYYKWAVNIPSLKFFSKINNCVMVQENNQDVWKLSGLTNLRVKDRYKICNSLYNKNLYCVENFKTNSYIYIPFSRNNGDKAFTINNYRNIIGEYLLYIYPMEYKRCVICNSVIKKTRSPKKYCSECARIQNIKKTKENKKSLKTRE